LHTTEAQSVLLHALAATAFAGSQSESGFEILFQPPDSGSDGNAVWRPSARTVKLVAD